MRWGAERRWADCHHQTPPPTSQTRSWCGQSRGPACACACASAEGGVLRQHQGQKPQPYLEIETFNETAFSTTFYYGCDLNRIPAGSQHGSLSCSPGGPMGMGAAPTGGLPVLPEAPRTSRTTSCKRAQLLLHRPTQASPWLHSPRGTQLSWGRRAGCN